MLKLSPNWIDEQTVNRLSEIEREREREREKIGNEEKCGNGNIEIWASSIDMGGKKLTIKNLNHSILTHVRASAGGFVAIPPLAAKCILGLGLVVEELVQTLQRGRDCWII